MSLNTHENDALNAYGRNGSKSRLKVGGSERLIE